MDAINACPHHDFEKFTLSNFFYDGFTLNMKQFPKSMYNVGFFHKPDNEAIQFLSSITWEESLARETSKPMLNYENKRGIYQVNDNTDIRASLARLHRRLDDMSLKREVNTANDVENKPIPCHTFLSYDHHVERYPSLFAMRETLEGQAKFIEQYKAPPFRNNYNNNS